MQEMQVTISDYTSTRTIEMAENGVGRGYSLQEAVAKCCESSICNPPELYHSEDDPFFEICLNRIPQDTDYVELFSIG